MSMEEKTNDVSAESDNSNIKNQRVKRQIDSETKIGAIFGVIALVAILIEVSLQNFNASAIVGGIKDAASVLVSVIVLIVAIRAIKPLLSPKSFEDMFNEELDGWAEKNYPLIVRSEVLSKKVNQKEQSFKRFFMLTDHDHIFDYAKDAISEKWKTGLFVEMPEIRQQNYVQPTIIFYLNKSTFIRRVDREKLDSEIVMLANKFAGAILNNYKDMVASADDKESSVIIKFRKGITTREDMRELVGLLSYVMNLYSIAS